MNRQVAIKADQVRPCFVSHSAYLNIRSIHPPWNKEEEEEEEDEEKITNSYWNRCRWMELQEGKTRQTSELPIEFIVDWYIGWML